MRHLVSGLTAAVTAMLIGTLIAGAAQSAQAADLAKAQGAAIAISADGAPDQATADAAAYRTQLQAAMTALNAAYAELAARDAAYRNLLGTSQANADRLQASNRQLQQQMQQAIAQIQQLQTQQAGAPARAARHEDDD